MKDHGYQNTHSRPENPRTMLTYSSAEGPADEPPLSSNVTIASGKFGLMSSEDLGTEVMITRLTERRKGQTLDKSGPHIFLD